MKITSMFLTNVIIDEKETKKTGLWLIFIGILSLVISLLIYLDIVTQSNKNFPTYALVIFGVIIILIGFVLQKQYFK